MNSRRRFLRSAVAGTSLFPALMAELLAEDHGDKPRGSPHFAPRAKHVIFLFMSGGVSHVDSFDPKPKLTTDHGKLVALNHPETKDRPGYEKLFLKRPQWEFQRHGKCGTEVSTLFPHVSGCVDDLCVIRSMHADHSNHYNATLGMHTGSFNQARPSRTRPTPARRSGRPTSCPAAIRARSSSPAPNRCATCARLLPSKNSDASWKRSSNSIALICSSAAMIRNLKRDCIVSRRRLGCKPRRPKPST
jgi:hypothetical protein